MWSIICFSNLIACKFTLGRALVWTRGGGKGMCVCDVECCHFLYITQSKVKAVLFGLTSLYSFSRELAVVSLLTHISPVLCAFKWILGKMAQGTRYTITVCCTRRNEQSYFLAYKAIYYIDYLSVSLLISKILRWIWYLADRSIGWMSSFNLGTVMGRELQLADIPLL